MPALALALPVVAVCVEQFVEWKYGVTGVLGLLMLTVGVKAQNVTCSCIGAVVLALLLTH